MTPTEVTEKLGLLRMKDRSWYCHPSNAIEGDGLFEGELAPGDEAGKADLPNCRSYMAKPDHQQVRNRDNLRLMKLTDGSNLLDRRNS